jgi:hypothetical protein
MQNRLNAFPIELNALCNVDKQCVTRKPLVTSLWFVAAGVIRL